MKLGFLWTSDRLRATLETLLFSLLTLINQTQHAAEPVLVVTRSPASAAPPAAIPIGIDLNLPQRFAGNAVPPQLELQPLQPAGLKAPPPIPAQFDPARPGAQTGRLWFLLPADIGKEQRFKLRAAPQTPGAALVIQPQPNAKAYDFREGRAPVLRYCHGTVPVPSGIPTNYARGDYIMPLFGPHGELLTDDYPKDHPHHRGLGWSWPVTRWGTEVRDIWAVRGVWSRPVATPRLQAGPVCATLQAECVWKWGDTTPIVQEKVQIRVFRRTGGDRLVDIEIGLRALEDRVAIGGRPHGGYGGFGLRAQPAQQRKITRFTDPPGTPTRRSWLDYSGVFAPASAPAGLAIFEHPSNRYYPNALLEYPQLNYVMPAFPGEREVPLSRERPLILRHRVWIHDGMATADQLAAHWAAYAHPPKVRWTTD